MTRTRTRWGAALAATALMVLAGCGGAGADGDEPTLEFAVVAELTGKFAPFGTQLRAGVEQAAADLNASGAYPFTIAPRFYDCQSEQAICVSRTRDAVTGDGMPLVMGPVISLDIVAAAEVTQRADVPHVVFSVLPEITDDYSNTYRWSVQNDINNETVADYVAATIAPGETVAIVHANTDFGNGGAEQQVASLAARGITPVANIGHDPDQADYTPVVTELREKQPRFVLLTDSNPADVAKLLRQAREVGLGAQWIGADASGAIELAGDDAVGYMVVSPWFPDNAADPNSVELSAKFREAGVTDLGWVAAMAYDATKGVAEAALAQGGADADAAALTAGLNGLRDMPGTAAPSWTFGPDQRRGLDTATVARWTGTGYETVWPVPGS